ncbi:MAG: Gfo/Idh/MocA family oxidoreductase [Clostridia bacterium]|nr:Gfo/Idh/MocA family oxidoreductase [Clostridia bacterium]
MEKVTVGIIGIGGYAQISLDNIFEAMDNGRDDFEIVAFVDPYPESSKHYARLKEMNVPYFASVADMYRAHIHPGLCLISTPIQFHKDQICHCHSHNSNVLCEKPMTGDIKDLWMLEHSESDCDGFIAIGYQWSYSDPIQKLKKDIMDGVYGKAVNMKTLVMWPRDKKYFKRSTGWAGKIYASNGEKILDSVANNATAHYIHNILYVLGNGVDNAMEVTDMTASLIRANDIETFDTAIVKFKLENGADGLYIASHSTKETVEPQFEYSFENGVVTYSKEQGVIIGKLNDGRTITYGDPYENPTKKFFDCIDYTKNGSRETLCGVKAATAQVKFIAKLHEETEILPANPSAVKEAQDDRLYIEGLDEILLDCYRSNRAISSDELSKIAKI